MSTMPTVDLDPDTQLLALLLESPGNFVAGQKLTETLGISRVAVWGRLEKLREKGLGIEARRHRGYRLTHEPEVLLEPLLRAYAHQLGVRAAIHFHDQIDSTNSEAERLLAAGEEDPFLVVANEQTAGRGRMGRQWHSPERGNLYASFGFRPKVPPRELPVVTLCLGLAVARCLKHEAGLPVSIKWPNDLLIEERKVAGMLTEARVDSDLTRDLVYGLGVNIAADTNTWPEAVQRVATTLREHARKPLSVNQVAALVLRAVLRTSARFFSGERGPLWKDWEEFDALAGISIEASWEGRQVRGTANGIDEEGRLRLRLEDGRHVALHAGEVTIGSGPKKTG